MVSEVVHYVVGQRVVGKVEKILPFGVFVRLKDNTRAYIRCRELSWAGDIEPSTLVSLGQELAAVVIDPGGADRSVELSHKATLPDPWKEFTRRFQAGSAVIATVKSLVSSGAFVQIVPGVDGFIPVEELAPWKVERPDDLLWVGDHVEAVITSVIPTKRKVRLSIRQLLEQLGQADNIVERLRQKAGTERQIEASADKAEATSEEEALQPGEIEQIGRILVVEDDDEVRLPLLDWFCNQGCQTDGVATAREALERCQNQDFGLVLVDLDLPETDGFGLIQQLQATSCTVPVAVMSSPELIEEHLLALQDLRVAALFPKPLDLDDMRRFLLQLAKGEKPILLPGFEGQVTQVAPIEVRPFQKLAKVIRSSQPLAERFRQGLEQLVRETRAEVGIVFHLDLLAQKVSIVARTGKIPLNEDKVYGLMDSPVSDVILRGGVVWEDQASQERTNRFDKLLGLLPFESCIGVPIQAKGQVEHTLFLFHQEPGAFSRHRLRDAWAMATLFSVALESQALDERVQAMSRLLLSGQLAAGFGHEVYNKLSALDLQFRNLRSDFERLVQQPLHFRESLKLEIEQALDKAVETARDLKSAVREYRQLMEASEEQAVDVNQVICQTENQIRPLARRARVKMRPELVTDLPSAAGSSIWLRQVFLNLMLNAVQHMERKPDGRRVLEIATIYDTEDSGCPIKVRISDSGPGIHRQLWDKIFALGFTTKPGGSGLGLYIAQSLVESMGGRISVERSIVPIGTTFLVELPVAEPQEVFDE